MYFKKQGEGFIDDFFYEVIYQIDKKHHNRMARIDKNNEIRLAMTWGFVALFVLMTLVEIVML